MKDEIKEKTEEQMYKVTKKEKKKDEKIKKVESKHREKA